MTVIIVISIFHISTNKNELCAVFMLNCSIIFKKKHKKNLNSA